MICLENGVYYIECKVFIIDDLELCDQQMINWLCISILVIFFSLTFVICACFNDSSVFMKVEGFRAIVL